MLVSPDHAGGIHTKAILAAVLGGPAGLMLNGTTSRYPTKIDDFHQRRLRLAWNTTAPDDVLVWSARSTSTSSVPKQREITSTGASAPPPWTNDTAPEIAAITLDNATARPVSVSVPTWIFELEVPQAHEENDDQVDQGEQEQEEDDRDDTTALTHTHTTGTKAAGGDTGMQMHYDEYATFILMRVLFYLTCVMFPCCAALAVGGLWHFVRTCGRSGGRLALVLNRIGFACAIVAGLGLGDAYIQAQSTSLGKWEKAKRILCLGVGGTALIFVIPIGCAIVVAFGERDHTEAQSSRRRTR